MQNLDNLLNKETIKDIFLKHLEELKLSDSFEVVDIKRTTVLAPETYALLFKIHDNGQTLLYRGNASTKDLRNRSYIALSALNKINFSDVHLSIPQNVIYDKDYNLLVYKQIEGEIFYKNLNTDRQSLGEKISLCAQWLTKLHLTRVDVDLESYEFVIHRNHLAQNYPDVFKKMERLEKDYKNQLQSNQKNFIHGDFQPNNIVFDGSNIAVFDFNDSAYDSPMLDVASFLCQLHTMLLRKADETIYDDLEKIFMSKYQEKIPINESMMHDLKIYKSLFYLKIFASLNASTESGVDVATPEQLQKIYQFSQEKL